MRLPSGGRIDRAVPLSATVDDAVISGHPGDTVASAMIACGRLQVAEGRSGRPRGILAAGVEEPHAWLRVSDPHREVPGASSPATTVELYDGLHARTASTPVRPEPAGTSIFDKYYRHTDVLVVGAGPTGLAAALAASEGGARVMLVDERPEAGGRLLSGTDAEMWAWVEQVCAELATRPEVTVLNRSTALSVDRNYLLVAQRRTEHLGADAPEHLARQRLWHVRAKQVVLATGAHEQSIVFAGNDRPGVMLAGAVRDYLNRYAVLPGHRAVLFTTNDSAYDTAFDLVAVGAQVAAIVDTRPEPPADLLAGADRIGIEVHAGAVVTGTSGDQRIDSVRLATGRLIDCDLLAVSGGWNPALHLHSGADGHLRWDGQRAAFVPSGAVPGMRVAGAANGNVALAGCLSEGARAGGTAAADVGYPAGAPVLPSVRSRLVAPDRPVRPVAETDRSTAFIDLRREVTLDDVWRAAEAGPSSVEQVMRRAGLGTGADLGPSCIVAAARVLAEALGLDSPADLVDAVAQGTYPSVSFGLLAGRGRGELHDPVRTTPIHPWHTAHGARFEHIDRWARAGHYPVGEEDRSAAVMRECRAARTAVAVQDVSTLGRIEVTGRDAGEFLDRIQTSDVAELPVGSARYGMMCRADGSVFEHGMVLRLAEERFRLSTTTSNASAVLDWLEYWSQAEWPELRVTFTPVTEQWAAIALTGPSSRAVLSALAPDLDCSAEAFEFLDLRETVLGGGIPAMIARISFSGELAYEISVAGWHGLAVWEEILALGEPHGITPYGSEAMRVLRAEKGFPEPRPGA